MGKKIRVPSTTAQFVIALSKILRDHLGINIAEHEHWEFEKVADWETYPRARKPDEDAPDNELSDYYYLTSRVDWQHDCYLGVGSAKARDINKETPFKPEKIDIRVRLQKNYWAALGYKDYFYWWISIWVCFPNGDIRKATYTYWNDSGDLYEDEEYRTPASPPRKIAFWRESESEAA